MASRTLCIVFDPTSNCPRFTLHRLLLLSAYKRTGWELFPALLKWTVWPGSQLKSEVSALIFLPPRHITMTTDIEITLSPGKKAWVTSHSGTFVVHEESRVHSGEPVKDEYSAIWRGKIRLYRKRRWERPWSKSCDADPATELTSQKKEGDKFLYS